MAQPKNPPLSIRPGDELLAEIDALASRRGISRHAATLLLIRTGLQWVAPEAPKVLPLAEKAAKAAEPVKAAPKVVKLATPSKVLRGVREMVSVEAGEDQPARFSVPFAGDLKRQPMQKTPAKPKR